MFLQETHFSVDISNTLRSEFDQWEIIHAYGTSSSKGCSIFITKKLSYEVIDFHTDPLGRFIILNISIDDTIYTLINIYANNDKVSRNIFFQSINELAGQNSQGIKIIGGDMNDVLSSSDRYNSKSVIKPVQSLQKIIKDFDLNDVWRAKNKEKVQFTWKRRNGNEKSRIDFWLVENNIVPLVISADIRPACIQYTDHLAISIKLSKHEKRGPGFWKLNNMYLKDEEYLNLISNLIETSTIKYANETNKSRWELLKLDIKEASLNFAKKKSKQRKERISSLENRLSHLLTINNDRQIDENIKNEITHLETEIQSLYDIKAKGAQIRSKVEYIEEGEKSTKYFLNLEKARQSRKTVKSLNVEGKTITDKYEILEEEVKFYQKLYSSDGIHTCDINNYLDNTAFTSTLTNQEASSCEGNFKIKELTEAIQEMKTNKSPGLDGLTAEFYKQFWPLLGNLLNPFNTSDDYSRRQKHALDA